MRDVRQSMNGSVLPFSTAYQGALSARSGADRCLVDECTCTEEGVMERAFYVPIDIVELKKKIV